MSCFFVDFTAVCSSSMKCCIDRNVWNCCRKPSRPGLKVFHRCPLDIQHEWMSKSLIKPHSGSKARRRFLHITSEPDMNHRLELRRATQVIRVAPKANALHQCHRSFPRCSSNMQPGSADFPLLLSITRHQPFSSQTIDTQQGRDAFIEGQGLSLSYTHLMKRNGPSLTRCVF